VDPRKGEITGYLLSNYPVKLNVLVEIKCMQKFPFNMAIKSDNGIVNGSKESS